MQMYIKHYKGNSFKLSKNNMKLGYYKMSDELFDLLLLLL